MFEDFSAYEDCEPAGLELPQISLSESSLKELGLTESPSSKEILSRLIRLGIKTKGIDKLVNKQEYFDRAKQELDTFDELGFTDYILLNWDIVKFAKDCDIPVGEGRGSAASSLVLYLLDVVEKDPLKHSLFFERFVSKNRAKKITDKRGKVFIDGSLAPDVDTDVSYDKRSLVIDYIEKKHKGKTSKILTLNTLSSKLVIKEAVKYFNNLSDEDSNRISAMIPKEHGLVLSLARASEIDGEFKEWSERNTKTFSIARKIEGLNKNTGVHPSGIAICSQPIENVIPIQLTKDGELISGYEMDDVADLMVKFDILGLRTLTIANKCCEKIGISLRDIDSEDPFIYDSLQNFNHPCGLFQISADTNFEVTRAVKPSSLAELSDVVALARPGALDYVDDYVQNKEAPRELNLHEELDSILSSTKNVILFQEQLMQIANKVFGLSLEDAETLRRIVGKKKVDEMPAWRNKIFEAGSSQGLSDNICNFYWNSLEASANYSFNKSHSLCYASLAAKTVYLKYKYPQEFFCSILEVSEFEPEPLKVVAEVCKELPDFGIELLPPNLEHSQMNFSIEGRNIRYGLSSIKGISEKSKERLKDFIDKKPTNKLEVFQAAKEASINIAALSSLIYAGTLGLINRSRTVLESQAFNLLTDREKRNFITLGDRYGYDILNAIAQAHKDKVVGDDGKTLIKDSRLETFKNKFQPFKELFFENKKHEKLSIWWFEKRLLGYSFTHVLKDCFDSFSDLVDLKTIKTDRPSDRFRFVAQIDDFFIKKSRNGARYAKIDFSDDFGTITSMIGDFGDRLNLTNFLSSYKLQKDQIVVANGTFSRDGETIFIDNMSCISETVYTKLKQLNEK
jgi:DNA polymerase-3 subunit alpha